MDARETYTVRNFLDNIASLSPVGHIVIAGILAWLKHNVTGVYRDIFMACSADFQTVMMVLRSLSDRLEKGSVGEVEAATFRKQLQHLAESHSIPFPD